MSSPPSNPKKVIRTKAEKKIYIMLQPTDSETVNASSPTDSETVTDFEMTVGRKKLQPDSI
jgi:hypothetical protein